MSSRREFLKYLGTGVAGFVIGSGVTAAWYESMMRKPAPPEEMKEEEATKPTEEVTKPTGAATIPSEPIKVLQCGFFSGILSAAGEQENLSLQIAIDIVNEQGGILGRKVELIGTLDEAAGTEALVKAFRETVATKKPDVVIGLTSSGNGMALAPLIEEELHVITFPSTSTTSKLFEEADPNPHYFFRTCIGDPSANVADVLMIKAYYPHITKIATISPDYQWGRDMVDMFKKVLARVMPEAEVIYEAWPPLGKLTDFSPHITAIMDQKPELVYCCLWGGDMNTFLSQAAKYGMFGPGKIILHEAVMGFADLNTITKEMVPEGSIGQFRSYYWGALNHNPLNVNFVNEFIKRSGGKYPTFYGNASVVSALLLYKQAVEKAYSLLGRYPNDDEIIECLEGSGVISVSGQIQIRPDDHEAIQPVIAGVAKHEAKYPFPVFECYFFDASQTMRPSARVPVDEWIRGWMEV